MSDERFEVSQQQLAETQQALDISALNGIVSLALLLKKRGLMTSGEAKRLHEMMSKPLSMPHNAANRAVQDAQQNLDLLFSVLIEP